VSRPAWTLAPCKDHGCKGTQQAYSSCYHDGRYVGKHVRALIQSSGEQPEGRYALHHCDNKRCIEPTHLYWGTQSDNMRDAVARGQHRNNLRNHDQTHNRLRGSQQPRSRWTEEIVVEMRRLYAAGEKQTHIASLFGCRQTDVSRIVNSKAWRHV
jgi:hypothetical protein